MKFKIIKLNFRLVSHLEPLNIQRVPCQSKIHPRCHDFFIPDHEGQVECLLCTNFRTENNGKPPFFHTPH